MPINIGSQQAHLINNVDGDQHISGGQQVIAGAGEVPRAAPAQLRAAVATAALDPATERSVSASLDEIEGALQADDPDPTRVEPALRRLTRLLVAAEPAASAAQRLVAPIEALVGWLGQHGAAVARMLPALLP